MSQLSFKLSKKGKVWHATGKLPGAKTAFDIDCGDGSEQSARKMAGILLERRAQLVEASRVRWRKFHAEKAKAAAAPAAPEADDEPDDVDEQLAAAAEHEPAPAPPARDHEKIRAKLLALGDSVTPDEVIPPGGERGGQEDDDPEPDEETGELVSEVLAGVVVNYHTRKLTKILKARKPPRRPGEPDDRLLAWEHDGIAYNMNKLFGKAVALGPTGKMLVGIVGVTAMMMLDSEPIEGARAPEAPTEQAAEAPRGNANGTPTNEAAGETGAAPTSPAQLSLVKRNPPPLGKF